MENNTVKNQKGSLLFSAGLVVFLYECAGTCLLMYAVLMGANISKGWGPALTLFLICSAIGPITGGHVNPAVTLGVLILKYDDFCRNLCWGLITVIG